jgi:dTDP-4-dehydrorhamnose 3,5-epimerase
VRQTQGKLVRVTSGAVFDAVVDLRRSSPTFGRMWSVELSADNHRMLWVPPGLAHGMLVTSEYADFLYKCTDFYAPEHERTLAWDDPAIAVPWPLPAGVAPKLSAKDAVGASLEAIEKFP